MGSGKSSHRAWIVAVAACALLSIVLFVIAMSPAWIAC